MWRPQRTMIILSFLWVVLKWFLHWQEMKGKHNVWFAIISFGITMFLLYMWGFFK